MDFLTSLETGKKPLVSGEDGLNVVRISEAALESLKTGQAVKIKFGEK